MKKKNKEIAIIITKHAYKRAKKRLSFTTQVLKKMARRAYERGTTHADMKGLLHKFADKIWFEQESANNVRIYGEIFYLFADNRLITLYPLPPRFKKLAKVSKQAIAC